MVRAAAVLTVLAALGVYYALADGLPDLRLWWEVALLSFALLPAFFLLVWLARDARSAGQTRLALAALALAVLAALLELVELEYAAGFAKFGAVIAAGWWFLGFFEAVSWVLLVALLIVPVDIFSVERGPTKIIVEDRPEIFDVLSVPFPLPGEPIPARLGLPDILFFALFLAAAARFGLRPGATWVAMVLSFGATIGLAVWWDVAGLAALPLLSAAFVLANADRLWRGLRKRRRL